MARQTDHTFDIAFYESVLRRDPGYADVVELLGGLYTEAGRLEDGLKMDRKLVRLRPQSALAHYNLACSLALLKRPALALKSLAAALACGYDDPRWMQSDQDLVSLHEEPAFAALLHQATVNAAPKT
jgi:tetratricopeptide (TPR) repeat protein